MQPEHRPALQPPVLLMDEYRPFLTTIRRVLIQELGLTDQDIIETDSAREGKEILSSGRARSLITGLLFPDGDGVSVIASIDPKIPTWVITAQSDADAERYCREVLGVMDYIQKPIDTDVLVTSLTREG
jgi:DNA-binding NtrC family response regulator